MYLKLLILPLIIKITESITIFSLKIYISACLNFLKALLENCDDNKKGCGFTNLWLISCQLSGNSGT